MSILGSIIAIGAGLAFGAIGILVLWGSSRSLRQEIRTGFVSRPASSGSGQLLTVIGLALPLVITAIFGLAAAVRLIQVAVGLG